MRRNKKQKTMWEIIIKQEALIQWVSWVTIIIFGWVLFLSFLFWHYDFFCYVLIVLILKKFSPLFFEFLTPSIEFVRNRWIWQL